jgi:accessory colonization factor AcfC
VKGQAKAAEILHRSNAQYAEEILSHASVYDWHNKFSEYHMEVSNLLHAHIQIRAVTDVNIRLVEGLILRNRQITVCNIAYNSAISV